MDVAVAVVSRRSIRAFLARPVAESVVRELLEAAARAPSGSNLQPWFVHALMGEPRDELVRRVHARMGEFPRGEGAEYAIHPHQMPERYAIRYTGAAARVYVAAGIARDDVAARQRHLARGWDFFGAPVGLLFTVERLMGPGQWMDLGMYLQSLMLLAEERGLATCAQEAWALWPRTVRAVLGLPDTRMLVCGMALGYRDPDAAINGFVSERVPFDDYATIVRAIPPHEADVGRTSTSVGNSP